VSIAQLFFAFFVFTLLLHVSQHFCINSGLFITFVFLCVMCLIGHDSGVLHISYMSIYFLSFYYGCQMAGLINVEYIYIILVWIKKCNVLLYVMSITCHYVYPIILCAPQSWWMVRHGLPGLTVDVVCHVAHLWASTQRLLLVLNVKKNILKVYYVGKYFRWKCMWQLFRNNPFVFTVGVGQVIRGFYF
jgi:hypothetical protein